MRCAGWSTDESPCVGIVSGATDRSANEAHTASESDSTVPHITTLESAITDAGGSVVTGNATTVCEADPTIVLGVGRQALSALATIGTNTPIVPVAAGPGIASAPVDDIVATVEDILDGNGECTERPVLTVTIDDHHCGSALFDVTLVTDEPARISEYSLRYRDEERSQFRADGITIATPAGSHGYASNASGPLLSPAVEAVVAVPIAPFVTHGRQWVLPDDSLAVTVERDECAVVCQVDGDLAGTVTPDNTVRIAATESLSLCSLPTQSQSQSPADTTTHREADSDDHSSS